MKVTVIGAGSTYTPELVNGFLVRRARFPLNELYLMDTDARRLEVVGGFARRMLAAAGDPFNVTLTTDRRLALRGADYVITQLRVGQMPARRQDEYLGRRHGLIGQETTGVGGMSNALRTIPVILQIAVEMRQLAPSALLVNFTNPAGLVTEALQRYAPQVASVGVCNVPITVKMGFLDLLQKTFNRTIAPESTQLNTLGLNHLSWHRGLTLDGENLWPRLLPAYLDELRRSASPAWDLRTVETLRMIPNDYLQYYYYPARKLAAQQAWPPSRAEQVMLLEKDLLRQYADLFLDQLPAGLMQRGGAYYSTMATQLLSAHYNDLGEIHVVNTRHAGAVAGWPADWVLEMPCKVDRQGIHPLPAEPLPPACFGLLAQVKAYEQLTVEAALYGDRQAAYQALLAHPLGPQADQVQDVLDDLLETHRAYLPQFWEQAGI
jgi:6-phospho-beta-glucosidase